MPKQYTHIELHPDGRAHTQKTTLLCENGACGKEFTIADSFSFPACIALSGPELRVSMACEEEQHFGCSPECALALHNQCMQEHILPRFYAAREAYRAQQAAMQAAQAAAMQKTPEGESEQC